MRFALDAQRSQQVGVRAAATGVTLRQLMERAGEAVALEAANMCIEGRIVVVAGGGNNGGDGWVAAQHLHALRRDVELLTLCDPGTLTEPAAGAAQSAIDAGVRWTRIAGGADCAAAVADCCLVVDALLGIGAHGPVREPQASVISAMAETSVPILAVDTPSGVDAATGQLLGPIARANATLTFSAIKPGLLFYPGAEVAGRIRVVDIGVPAALLTSAGGFELWDARDYAAVLPRIAPDAHKGSRGRVLVVAGSQGMSGAACLASGAAFRAGAGYVYAAVPSGVVDIVDSTVTSAVTVSLPDEFGACSERAAALVIRLAATADALVIGPGLTPSRATAGLVRRVLAATEIPAVVDADALNALAAHCGTQALSTRGAPTVITPHPGELARLLGVTTSDIQSDRALFASKLAGGQLVCLLKGARTVISDGTRCTVIEAGDPVLATAGTGDVLAGVMGALLAQGLQAIDAAALAAHLHARAGEVVAERQTSCGAVANDVMDAIPAVMRELRAAHL